MQDRALKHSGRTHSSRVPPSRRRAKAGRRERRRLWIESLERRLVLSTMPFGSGDLLPANSPGTGSISGLAYLDHNGNGQWNTGEPGVPGSQVTLSGTTTEGNVPITRTALTGDDGSFHFGNVSPGIYSVTQTQPKALRDGQESTTAAGVVVANDTFSNIVITSGASVTGLHFGERDVLASYVKVTWFFASGGTDSSRMREMMAHAEELNGNQAIADAIRSGDSTLDGDENTAPVAISNNYSVNENALLAVDAAGGVLANDVDPDGDPLTAVLVSGPSNGNLTLNSDGSFSYTPNTNFNGTDSFTYKANDGFTDSNVTTASLTVTAENDAPVLADTALTLTVAEDAGVPSGAVGSLVSAFTGGISDVDSGAVKGIAITATKETNGTWYYSTNGGTNWTAVGTVSAAQSLLLADNANTRLYFAPAANYNGTSTAALTFRAWDQTSGTAGTKVASSTNGGTTAFSSATDVIDVTVTAVNDAPVLADTVLTLTVAEDAGVPSGAVSSLVSAFTGGISDVDSGAVKGIAITATNETNGTWYYSTNGGTNWTAVGTVSAAQSLLLADNANTRLYFAPAASYNGTSTSALTFRAWDQTSGTAGTKVASSTNGGTTAFSSATDVIDVTVTAENDAPVLADTALTLTVAEDAGARPAPWGRC